MSIIENTTEINDIYEFIREINSLFIINGKTDKYVFRGQGDYKIGVTSGALRRLSNTSEEINIKELADYHDLLITSARRFSATHNIIEGKSDLIVLSELQHYGAATNLIDFTNNSLIALFFACKSSQTVCKVYCLKEDTFRFLPISPSQNKNEDKNEIYEDDRFSNILLKLEKNEKELGSKKRFVKWLPHQINNRIIKQDSIFIITSNGKISENEFDKIIIINKEKKKELLNELSIKFNITEESIYPDFFGFVLAHSVKNKVPISENEISSFYQLGLDNYFKGNFNKSVEMFNQVIKIDPKNYKAFFNRGMSFYYLKDYEKAISDLGVFIEVNDQDVDAYFHRGYSYLALSKYEDAISDYTKLLNLNPNHLTALYNRGFLYLFIKDTESAEKDLKKVIILNPEFLDANFNLVLTYILKKDTEEATIFLDRLQEKVKDPSWLVSLFCLKAAINIIMKKDYSLLKTSIRYNLIKTKIEEKSIKFNISEMKTLIGLYFHDLDKVKMEDILNLIEIYENNKQ